MDYLTDSWEFLFVLTALNCSQFDLLQTGTAKDRLSKWNKRDSCKITVRVYQFH